MPVSVQGVLSSFGIVGGPTTSVLGNDLVQLVKLLFSTSSGITAYTTGGITSATVLTAAINEVVSVFTTNSSVMLPPALTGMSVTVINHGANTLAVYGYIANPNNAGAGDTIAPHTSSTQQATTTGVTQITNLVSYYECFTTGKWKQINTA